MKLDKYYVAEYSFSQNNFHCDRLDTSITKNKDACFNGQESDWIIIGIFDTWEETQNFINEFKKKLKN